ncbi:MAG: 2-oxo acid dehydrogenase subunit E2 [Nocardioides sp.]|jgi:2-oxoacid dehydrogenase/acyltransferase catalytic subunit
MSGNRRVSRRLDGWRKLAGATWGPPSDPQFYGDVDIDAGALLEIQRRMRDDHGVHVTLTHLVGRAVAHGLASVPDLQVRLAFGREHPRETTDVFFIVASGGGRDLTGVKVCRADTKSVIEIATELEHRRAAIGAGTDAAFGRSKRLLTLLPPSLLGGALRLGAWLTSDLNLDLSTLGMPRQAFGSAMVTSVGMWGIRHAYSPLAAYYRVPVLVCIGAVTERPVSIQGRIVARPMLTLTATFDHRYVDGYQAAEFAHAVEDYCREPERHERQIEQDRRPGTSGHESAGGSGSRSPAYNVVKESSMPTAAPTRSTAETQPSHGGDASTET